MLHLRLFAVLAVVLHSLFPPTGMQGSFVSCNVVVFPCMFPRPFLGLDNHKVKQDLSFKLGCFFDRLYKMQFCF